jgi:hypothetical protein
MSMSIQVAGRFAMDGDALREGIFCLRTRRFGTVAELMVKRLVKLGKGRSLFHDLYDDAASKRIEVKFSTVLRKSTTCITESTLLRCIEAATSEQRMVPFDEWRRTRFDCNIQQVKRREFDVLYYGLFFSDCVAVFRIGSMEIGPQINYSDRQHKGNIGEGQFHVSQDNLQFHLDNYLYQTLTYDRLLELLSD